MAARQQPVTRRAVGATEAATMLGIHRSTVYALIHSGKLAAVQISPNRYIIPIASIDRLLGETTVEQRSAV